MNDFNPDSIQVAVWSYPDQEFIIPIRCENEKRVRVDYFGSLEDLDVFQIEIVNNDGVNITYNLVSDSLS